MVYLYTADRKQEVLQFLNIKPINGKVTGREAARILSWRAREEEGIEHQYNPSTLRRHVKQGNLVPYPGTKVNEKTGESRKSLYDVDVVFELQIAPKRGAALKDEAA